MRKKRTSFVSILLIIIISFCGGYFFNNYINSGSLTFEQTRALNQAAKIINDAAINEQDGDYTVDFALKGMAASLNDPYAYYFTADELKEYNNSVSGVVEGGIGVQIVMEGNECRIVDVYSGLTAKSAGIKVNDVIIKVDNEAVADLSLEEISSKVKGEEGTSVKITVLRDNKELTFNVQRSNGQRQMTEYSMIENTKILYVKIISFRGNAAEYFKKAIEFGEENQYESILVDIRDNGGGELSVFASIADVLLPEAEIFYAMDRHGNKNNVITSDAEYINKPICVLVNASSASASEAFAGSLRDVVNAKIVGTKTFGKGIMQTSYSLTNGGVFKLTTGKYYLPSGQCIHEKGIEPDYNVELSEELSQKYWLRNMENDLQFKKAVKLLTN
ncbi:MAG: PDZ domain-containing protein [Clostridiales bacterium]|nr:PDZ domain-containing protein [Clostridiales bacterium]